MRMLVTLCCSMLAAVRLVAQNDPADIVESPDHTHYSRRAYEAGRREAEKDVRENRLVVQLTGGPPGAADSDWRKLLSERYHIEVKELGCTVTYDIAGYTRGYNEISLAEIERRFGAGLLRSTRDEAEKQWVEAHKK
jgi:hypothetical protein